MTETADDRWKEAVAALAGMGLLAVPALIDATGDDHPEVRRGANTALRQIGPAIIPFLVKALRHEKSLVRESAARGLYGFAPQAQKAIPALTDALKDSDASVRQWVADRTREIWPITSGRSSRCPSQDWPDLLNDVDFMVREWSAHALGFIGPAAEDALPALEAALHDDDSSVKEAVADAIRRIKKDEKE